MVILDTTGKVVTSATIKSKPAQTPIGRAKRYANMCDQISVLLPLAGDGSKVRIEGYSFGSQGRAITSLAEFRGKLLDTLMQLQYRPDEVEEVPPSSLKSFFTGSGKASKEDMLAAAKEHGFDCGKDHNQADAYALAAWAHQGMKTKPKVNKPRKARVPKVCNFCGGRGWVAAGDDGLEVTSCPKCTKKIKPKCKACGDRGTEIESVYGFPPETVPCSKCKKGKKNGKTVPVRKGKT